MKNQAVIPRNLYLVGIVLAILGSFLPWWCWGDFIYYCTPGISMNFASDWSIGSTEQLIILFAIAVATGLILQALGAIKTRKMYVVSFFLLVLVYFVIGNLLILESKGGFLVFFLSVIIAWLAFHPPKFIYRLNVTIISISILLVIFSGYQLASAILKQITERQMIGGLTIQLGLPIVFIGSLLILAAGVLQLKRIHPE